MKNQNEIKSNAGLWIDHREAIIVVLSKGGEETTRIDSKIAKQLRRSGDHQSGAFEAQQVPADDSRQRDYSGQLARYYEKIISRLRDAGSVLIVGPGEAKGELKRKFDRDGSNPHVLVVEAADKMTERQLVAYVRRHFQADLTEVEPRKHGRILI